MMSQHEAIRDVLSKLSNIQQHQILNRRREAYNSFIARYLKNWKWRSDEPIALFVGEGQKKKL